MAAPDDQRTPRRERSRALVLIVCGLLLLMLGNLLFAILGTAAKIDQWRQKRFP
jgi:hypothetical protein